ncbi:MAG: hypothetical protein QN120_05225 [Armatimonadota bacterium]|nr:hypothetical protein [Armatimonadota bacterium]
MKYEPPTCVALTPDDRPCNHPMTPLGERDPAFGPNWRPGCWVFRCTYCGAFRAIEKTRLDQYLRRR